MLSSTEKNENGSAVMDDASRISHFLENELWDLMPTDFLSKYRSDIKFVDFCFVS